MAYLMKIVICGSMSASKEMMGMKNSLEEGGHIVVVPRNTDKYASGEFTSEDRRESTQNKIELLTKHKSILSNVLSINLSC
jgi:hypothetical protein